MMAMPPVEDQHIGLGNISRCSSDECNTVPGYGQGCCRTQYTRTLADAILAMSHKTLPPSEHILLKLSWQTTSLPSWSLHSQVCWVALRLQLRPYTAVRICGPGYHGLPSSNDERVRVRDTRGPALLQAEWKGRVLGRESFSFSKNKLYR